MRNILKLTSLLVFALLLISDGHAARKKLIKPLIAEVPESQFPLFDDDLSFENLNQAIERQFEAFERIPLKGSILLDGKSHPLTILKTSLLKFKEIVNRHSECFTTSSTARDLCVSMFNEELRSKFKLYRPLSDESELQNGKKVHFTAYYSPVIEASLTPTEDHTFAIYELPSNVSTKLTREEIDFDQKLKGRGFELFYVKDPFELYMMHIEGGGAVSYVDNQGKKQRQYLSYLGNNGNKFRFISVYMQEKGYIDNSAVSVQRRFLSENPQLWREIYSYCQGYIFFKKTSSEPLGMENIPLTDGRSLAQDKRHYPRKGLLSYVVGERPVRENGKLIFKPFARFFIDQDTGSAIKGEARADLYFGFGDEAKLAAENLNNYGDIYFLIAK